MAMAATAASTTANHVGLLGFKKEISGKVTTVCCYLEDSLLFVLDRSVYTNNNNTTSTDSSNNGHHHHQHRHVDVSQPVYMVFVEECAVAIEPDEPDFNNAFSISCVDGEMVYFSAATPVDREEWMKIIQSVISRHRSMRFLENVDLRSRAGTFTVDGMTTVSRQVVVGGGGGGDTPTHRRAATATTATTTSASASGSDENEDDNTSTTTTAAGAVTNDDEFDAETMATIHNNIPHAHPQDLQAEPFDKQKIFAHIRALNELEQRELRSDDRQQLANNIMTLRSHAKVLNKELVKLRNESAMHIRALEEARKDVRAEQGRRDAADLDFQQSLSEIMELQTRLEHALRGKQPQQQSTATAAAAAVDELALLQQRNESLLAIEAEAGYFRRHIAERGMMTARRDILLMILGVIIENTQLQKQVNQKYEHIYRMTRKKAEEFEKRFLRDDGNNDDKKR